MKLLSLFANAFPRAKPCALGRPNLARCGASHSPTSAWCGASHPLAHHYSGTRSQSPVLCQRCQHHDTGLVHLDQRDGTLLFCHYTSRSSGSGSCRAVHDKSKCIRFWMRFPSKILPKLKTGRGSWSVGPSRLARTCQCLGSWSAAL